MTNRIYNWIKKWLILLILVLIIIFIFNRMKIFDGWFRAKPLLIDQTPLVIEEIRSVADLNTATLYQDVIVDSIAPATIPFAARREIVLIIKGKVTAGLDMDKLSADDVFASGDSVHITLPGSVIRDVIINPSDVETFYESGKWNNEEITALKLAARQKLLVKAAENDLLEKANVKSRSLIEGFLKALQFKKIIVVTKGNQ